MTPYSTRVFVFEDSRATNMFFCHESSTLSQELVHTKRIAVCRNGFLHRGELT